MYPHCKYPRYVKAKYLPKKQYGIAIIVKGLLHSDNMIVWLFNIKFKD